jgi:hypothetical protein
LNVTVLPEEVGRELSDLAFGIVEQNWLEQHVGKVVDLKSIGHLDAAEWELTYLILFAITKGCASAQRDWTTQVLKAFHSAVLAVIASQAGQDIADGHKTNLPARYRLYEDALKGEEASGPHKLLAEAAAIQILGRSIEDPHTAENFRETIKVIFTEVKEAAMKVMRARTMPPRKDRGNGV